jgi:hypothetical protein
MILLGDKERALFETQFQKNLKNIKYIKNFIS